MALIEFRSRAAAAFFMRETLFAEVCRLWGRPSRPRGCLEPEELPPLIASLEGYVAREREQERKLRAEHERLLQLERDEERQPDPKELEEAKRREEEWRQRAANAAVVWPLLDMMRRALARGQQVMWGVP